MIVTDEKPRATKMAKQNYLTILNIYNKSISSEELVTNYRDFVNNMNSHLNKSSEQKHNSFNVEDYLKQVNQLHLNNVLTSNVDDYTNKR